MKIHRDYDYGGYEGYPKFYVKRNLKIDVTGLNENHFGEVNAMVYIMTKKASDTRSINPIPSEHYYSILHFGYKRFGFDGELPPLIEAGAS